MAIKIRWWFKEGLTIAPFVFLPKNANECLIKHEEHHIKQQGWLSPLWCLKWLCDKKFRKKVEMEAMTVQLDCLKENGYQINFPFYLDYMQKKYKLTREEANTFLDQWRSSD